MVSCQGHDKYAESWSKSQEKGKFIRSIQQENKNNHFQVARKRKMNIEEGHCREGYTFSQILKYTPPSRIKYVLQYSISWARELIRENDK